MTELTHFTAKNSDLGDGFTVRRSLPSRHRKTIGPWIFFDHFGPVQFEAGQIGINVRPHPHINLATVTYLFEGEILHRDSLGNELAIQPGAINLKVAGKGITHSERERETYRQTPRRLHGLQLWHVLPEDDEECDPAFYHHPKASIPETLWQDTVALRVLMGSAYGLTSPVKTFYETLYVEANLPPQTALELPAVQELGVYVVSGQVICNGQVFSEGDMLVIEAPNMRIQSLQSATQIAMIGGESVGRRYIDWNFVSSRKSRIEDAKAQWQAGRFPAVLHDTQEFIPLP